MMKNITLVFPDVSSIADFLLVNRIGGAEINYSDLLLTGVLSYKQIVAAREEFRAEEMQSYYLSWDE